MTTVTITGSYGNLTVHRESGLILAQEHYGDDADDADILYAGAADEYADIVWIDPATLPVGEGAVQDICRVSFVDDQGRFYGPLATAWEVDHAGFRWPHLRPVALLPAYCLSHLGTKALV